MPLQAGKQAAIEGVKKAFERAAEMDGRKPPEITNELATDIINAVIVLIMAGDVSTQVAVSGTAAAQTGTGTGKVS